MKIHFTGIGGIGISALAQFCLNRGDRVSGSESQETGVLPILRDLGIDIKIPQTSKNIPQDIDLLIYTEAVPETNSERTFAQENNIPQKSYFELLGEISHEFKTIAVAGTHGKTTTTGFIASGFLESTFPATIFVGSKLRELGNANFKAGTNNYLLLEACEYRNNFQFLDPQIVILTNIELDHIDYYKSEDHYFETFSKFCEKAKVVIFHEKDKNAQKVLKFFKGKRIAVSNQELENLPNLEISGIHNRENAILAETLGSYLEGEKKIDFKKFKKGLSNFSGAWRRQEFLGEKIIKGKTIKIYDDYGHHPTEIKATLQSFREKYPTQKIALIFEPHQYSRTKQFFNEFLESFKGADFIGVYPIYAARDTEAEIKAISVEDFKDQNQNIQIIKNILDLKNITQNLSDGDILLFMGAGKIDEFAHSVMTSEEI